jgi:hypothetical protein
MAAMGVLAVFFHRLKVGPKLPQPIDDERTSAVDREDT